MKNKKSTKTEFPRIYRFITDYPLFFIFFVSVFCVLVIIVGFDSINNLNRVKEIIRQKNEIYLQIQYWEKILGKYKGYRDGYFELATLNYRLGDFEKSQTYLQESLKLDPNFEQGKKLERILNSRN